MRDLTRFVQLSLLAAILFVALLAAWGVAAYRTPLAWFAAVTAWVLFLWLTAVVAVDTVQDAQLKAAQHRRLMHEAGYVRGWVDVAPEGATTAKWVRDWLSMDGTEEEPAPSRVRPEFDYHNTNDKEDPTVKRARLRALLQWIYERQREYPRLLPGDCYGQKPGRAAYPGTYDQDMNELARRGFLQGHSKGHTGTPALQDQAAALVAFDGQDK